MWQKYIIPANIEEALQSLSEDPGKTRLIAGGTDLILEIERGQRKDIETVIDVSRLPGLAEISLDKNGWIHIGAGVTHNQVAASSPFTGESLAAGSGCMECRLTANSKPWDHSRQPGDCFAGK